MVDRAGAHLFGGHPNEGRTGGCSRSTELPIVALKRSWRHIFRWETGRRAEKRIWLGFAVTTEAQDSRAVDTAPHMSHRTIDPQCLENPRPEGAESTLTENVDSPFHAEPRQISEALALSWDVFDWIKGKIRIRRKWNGKGYGPPKSLMSRKPVEMTKGLATVLEVWRQETMFAKDGDLLFPSYRKDGKQPRLGSMIVLDYIRPAAIIAGVLEQQDGGYYYDGEPVTRFGFHSLRHGLGTWLAENGTSPEVIQRMLRHSSKDMTMHYIHAKARKAQEQYIAELGIVDGSQSSDSGCSLRVQ